MSTETKTREVRPVATTKRVSKLRLGILASLVVLLVIVAGVWAANTTEEPQIAASDRAIENALDQMSDSVETVEIGRHHDYALRHMGEGSDYLLRPIDD